MRWFVVVCITSLLISSAHASPEKRVALVVGNAAYKNGTLANPVNDARAMASRLRTLGFDVLFRENLKTVEIGSTYRAFRNKISPGSVALVFYAGHGLQVKGQNYFPTVDSSISSEEDVPLQSLNLGTLLDNMEEAKAGISLLFLDACRDNPFARHFRSSARGLAKIEAASGTLIHYATKPGSVAEDGTGKNGTYTEALLSQIGRPGIPVELMLKQVTNQVVGKTTGKQEPWVEGSLRGEFYFASTGAQSPTQASADPETEAWLAAESAATTAGYKVYLDAFPNGRYVAAAKIKLTALIKPETPLVEPVQPLGVMTAVAPIVSSQQPAQVSRSMSDDEHRSKWLSFQALLGNSIVRCFHPTAVYRSADIQLPETMNQQTRQIDGTGRVSFAGNLTRAVYEMQFVIQVRQDNGATLVRVTPFSDNAPFVPSSNCGFRSWQRIS